MLTSKIRLLPLIPSDTLEPEDILCSSLGTIFPDDIANQHGDASTSVIYESPSFGEIQLSLADPKGEDERMLFSHFLWNSSLLMGELIEEGRDEVGRRWSVEGEKVLELGAGTGLAGIIAALKGAKEVTISDYPSPEVLSNIQANITRNLTPRSLKDPPQPTAPTTVAGHIWGDLTTSFALTHKSSFDKILIADCLWMPWQHGNLLASIAWFLAPGGKAWVIAGFHTGREKMKGFFDGDLVGGKGLRVQSVWERNADGRERAWVEDRGREDVTERKRWLVLGVLVREEDFKEGEGDGGKREAEGGDEGESVGIDEN